MMAQPQDEKLESRLIKESWVNPLNFIKAKDEQARSGKSLYTIMIKLGFMTEEKVYEFFSRQALIPFVKVSDYQLDPQLLKMFPESSYRDNCFLPLAKVDGMLYVCMANPLDANLVSTLEMQSDGQVFPMFASPSAIYAAVSSYFGPEDKFFNMEDLISYPQTVGAVPFWRESDRLAVKLDMEFKLNDERVRFSASSYIQATACDISSSGKATGFRTFIFIPQGVKILIKFPSKDQNYEVAAEVARCNMEREGNYYIGAKFIQIKDELIQSILKDAVKPS
jgi:hypothetical protein